MAGNRIEIRFNTVQFATTLRAYAERVGRSVDDVVRESATRVRAEVVARSPVDTTRLQASWLAPVRAGALAWKIATTVPYAPVLEYGGYPGVGPKTVAVTGSQDLGFGLTPPRSGIYSRQAPHGWVRKALANEGNRLLAGIGQTLQQEWRR